MQKVVELYSGDEYDDGFPPKNAQKFQAWVKGHLDKVPIEFQESLRLDLDAASRHDSIRVIATLYYFRPETPQEEAERLAQEAHKADRQRAGELETLARLKAKYENPAIRP